MGSVSIPGSNNQDSSDQSSTVSFTADSLTKDQWKSEKERAGIAAGSMKLVEPSDPNFVRSGISGLLETPQLQKADARVGKHISEFRAARAKLSPEAGQADLDYFNAIEALIEALDTFLETKDFVGPAAEAFKLNVQNYRADVERITIDPTFEERLETARKAALADRNQFYDNIGL